MRRSLIVGVLIAVAVAGCKSKEEEAAEKAMKALGELGKAFGKAVNKGAPGATEMPSGDNKDPMKAMGALAKLGKSLSTALAGATKAGTSVVNWRKLQDLLPEKLGDWESKRKVYGSTGGFGGMKVSRARRSYMKANRRLRVEIADSNMSPIMRTPFKFAMKMATDSSRGFRKGITVDGHSGILEWRNTRKRSRLRLLVADRFIVKVSVTPATKSDEAVEVAKSLKLSDLSAMK